MLTDNEQELQQTDVQDAPSSEEQPVQMSQADDAQESAPKQEAPKETPFHEHPRFKELVEQKNRYAEESKSYAQRLQEMERRLQELSQPKVQKQEDPLLARLKGIDPEFGERFAKLTSQEQELQELKSWKAQFEADQLRTRAVSELSKLHEENKVSPEMRKIYDAQIQAAATANPRLGLQDLPNLYKQVHETFSKMIDDAKRAERESYVASKKADAKAPTSQPKGTTVKPSRSKPSGTPAEQREQMMKEILNDIRTQRNDL
jgi:hypothetical protein